MYTETHRMLIRDFKSEDAEDLFEILGDDETMKNCEPSYDFEKTENFLNSFCISRHGAVAAVHKDYAKVIGYILFNEQKNGVYEIGWFFNRAFWRQGYATEACKAVIKYAFEEMNAQKIFAETIDIVKSVHLMEKLGMKFEDIQRSTEKDNDGKDIKLYLYALLKDDWIKNNTCK